MKNLLKEPSVATSAQEHVEMDLHEYPNRHVEGTWTIVIVHLRIIVFCNEKKKREK